jgi:tetratricopeptide (TPR) repeat protein
MSVDVICSHCKKRLITFKRCSICKTNCYCDKKCQKLDWADHKIDCKSIEDVCNIVVGAYVAGDQDEIMTWKHRFADIVAYTVVHTKTLTFDAHGILLDIVGKGYESIPTCTVLELQAIQLKLSEVLSLKADLVGQYERYRDQGEIMCRAGIHMLFSGDVEKSKDLFRKARRVAESHGFYTVECLACRGLGDCYTSTGDHEEALPFFQNALAAAPLAEHHEKKLEMALTQSVATSLYTIHRYAEAAEFMPRLKELTREHSEVCGSFQSIEFDAFLLRIKLYEELGVLEDTIEELRELGNLVKTNTEYIIENSDDFVDTLRCILKLDTVRLGLEGTIGYKFLSSDE